MHVYPRPLIYTRDVAAVCAVGVSTTHARAAKRSRESVSHQPEKMDKLLLLLGFCSLASAQYQPNWDSLDARPLPAWYDQAKFGIFMHWGVFSVPSYGGGETGKGASEWFWWDWKGAKESWAVDFMEKNYLATFTYPDFAPQFKAELFSPGDWAQTIAASGAKYVCAVYLLASKEPRSLAGTSF